MTRTNRTRLLSVRGEFLQWTWGALAFFSMPILISQLSFASGEKSHQADWETAVCASVVFTFQCRWAIGNFRYLKETWSPRPTWVSLYTTAEVFNRAVVVRFSGDSALVLAHGATLCWMAQTIADLNHFLVAFLCLLVSDAVWLVYDPNVWPERMLFFVDFGRAMLRKPGKSVTIAKRTNWQEYYPARTWTWNNLVSAGVLGIIHVAARMVRLDLSPVYLVLIVGISAMNGFVDYKKTHFGLR